MTMKRNGLIGIILAVAGFVITISIGFSGIYTRSVRRLPITETSI
jgi:hypothetical protein